MIEVTHLSKSYGPKHVLKDVSFTVPPGQVTGFLGPNGAGKSTTMRLIMGLENPSAGQATVLGQPLGKHPAPLASAGALLDARSLNPARKARQSLLALADTHGIKASRVAEVLALTGLTDVADQRSGGFSLGMGQRLGIAAALLGDPRVLVLDEPVNGLDPEGVTWVRKLCRSLAAEGRTVLISSHLMSEVAQTADRVVVIGQGRILADASMDEFVGGLGEEHVRVASADAAKLGVRLSADGGAVDRVDESTLSVRNLSAEAVGAAALQEGVALRELVGIRPSLEDAYLALTSGAVEYRSGGILTPAPGSSLPPGTVPGGVPGSGPGAMPGAIPGAPMPGTPQPSETWQGQGEQGYPPPSPSGQHTQTRNQQARNQQEGA
ncbi:ABC transporter ATP-binding protein [Galactobacter sp.]|uniref:ABC transporter ATP-binding protein n=1 Tax=Galactobacter sp. TaxID=2676125 RepID=UPI00345CB3C2